MEEVGVHPKDGRIMLLVETSEEWRAWLESNHADSDGAWLVSWKKATGRPFVPYSDTVDEALCFGWVDSRPNTLDEERAHHEAVHSQERVRRVPGRASTKGRWRAGRRRGPRGCQRRSRWRRRTGWRIIPTGRTGQGAEAE